MGESIFNVKNWQGINNHEGISVYWQVSYCSRKTGKEYEQMIYRQEIYQNQQVHEGPVNKGNKETQAKLTILNWQKLENWIMLSVVREAGMQEVSWRSNSEELSDMR